MFGCIFSNSCINTCKYIFVPPPNEFRNGLVSLLQTDSISEEELEKQYNDLLSTELPKQKLLEQRVESFRNSVSLGVCMTTGVLSLGSLVGAIACPTGAAAYYLTLTFGGEQWRR